MSSHDFILPRVRGRGVWHVVVRAGQSAPHKVQRLAAALGVPAIDADQRLQRGGAYVQRFAHATDARELQARIEAAYVEAILVSPAALDAIPAAETASSIAVSSGANVAVEARMHDGRCAWFGLDDVTVAVTATVAIATSRAARGAERLPVTRARGATAEGLARHAVGEHRRSHDEQRVVDLYRVGEAPLRILEHATDIDGVEAPHVERRAAMTHFRERLDRACACVIEAPPPASVPRDTPDASHVVERDDGRTWDEWSALVAIAWRAID
jgi:hypothetical protein